MIELKKEDILTLKQIIATPSVSGHESIMNNRLINFIRKYPSWKVDIDEIRNVIFSRIIDKNYPTILFTCHKDKIGFIVEEILANGKIKLAPIGGINPLTIFNGRILLYNEKHLFFGTLQISLNKKDLMNSLYLGDFGFDSGNVVRFHEINIGDSVYFFPQFLNTKTHIVSPYLDNSVGIFTCLKVIDYFSLNMIPANIVVSFNSQEEVGLRGIKSVLKKIKPDLVIGIDVTGETNTVKVGKGPTITLLDYGIILPKNIQNTLERIARENKINYQLEIYTQGGTSDWRVTSIEGYTTIPIGVPIRNIHTMIETICIKDIEYLVNYVISIGKNFEKLHQIHAQEYLAEPLQLTCPTCAKIYQNQYKTTEKINCTCGTKIRVTKTI